MLSVCLIVKDEVDFLEQCILSIKNKLGNIVDDIVIADTGSTDGTIELIKKYECSLFEFEWCNDFSKARNFSLEKAKNSWVIVLDADEFIVDIDEGAILKFATKKNRRTLGEINIRSYSDNDGNSFTEAFVPRIFNKEKFVYKGVIHELPKLKDGTESKSVKLPVTAHHKGYINEVAKGRNKADRNIELIKKSLEKEDSKYLSLHLAKSYMLKADFGNAIQVLEGIIFDEGTVGYNFYSIAVVEYIRCLLNQKQDQVALVCENFWDRCFIDTNYVYYMGHVYMRNKYYEKSLDCFLEVLNRKDNQISPNMALYSLGELFFVIEMYEESLKYFEMCGDYNNANQNTIGIRKIIEENKNK